MINVPPKSDEIEISVFGPGYGESILLHVGDNNWFIVDSCIDPASNEPAPLNYLRLIKVNPSDAVKQVIATHWHDDHIRGIGEVIKCCSSADFICSDALDSDEFISLATAYSSRSMMESSGVDEFSKVLRILKERRRLSKSRYINLTLAVQNRLLWKGALGGPMDQRDCSIYSLSPSDAAVQAAKMDFLRLLPPDKEPKKRLISATPNRSAVTIWVTVGSFNILLGSDLEEDGDPRTGWSVIVNSKVRPAGRASFFKIPHHGSKNAHHPRVWTEILQEKPIVVLTPYELGNTELPTRDDVVRICTLTDKAYLTAMPGRRRITRRDRTVERTIRETVLNIRQVNSSIGQVRLRVNQSNQLNVELFGDALPLKRLCAS